MVFKQVNGGVKMIIMLILLLISVMITYHIWKKNCRSDGIISGIICSVILAAIIALFTGTSYSKYLDDRAFYTATKEQYHSAIEVYSDKAVIDMGKAAFTDLKYQSYQENIGRFITDLRNRIINYNISIVEKRTMANNLLFGWFIITPDADMVILKMRME